MLSSMIVDAWPGKWACETYSCHFPSGGEESEEMDVLDASIELCLCTWMSRGLKKANPGDRRERMG